jgi:transcriptional regulator with XRE-family HTH domain
LVIQGHRHDPPWLVVEDNPKASINDLMKKPTQFSKITSCEVYIMTIGHVLKLIRTNLAMTQKQMADRLGISHNYLSLIEGGKKDPTNDMVADFARELNISKEALLFASSDVPDELNSNDKRDFQRLQQNILSLLLFELNGELKKSA